MDLLPMEVIEKILTHHRLTIEDVVNFSATCTYFRNIVLSSQVVWRQKFRYKWPQLVDIFKETPNYYDEVRYIYELRGRTIALLGTMPARFYKQYELSDTDVEEWGVLMYERPPTYHYLVNHLRTIVNTQAQIQSILVVPLNTPGNKTLQYYASKVLRFIMQIHLTQVWQNFIELPLRFQILEKGAAFIAQWCQPHEDVSDRKISGELDEIVVFVRRRLKDINPEHPLFQVNDVVLNRWKIENLESSQWSIPHCREVMIALRDVIYTTLNFKGNNITYYAPENSFINEVLEKRVGLPITLSVVYESVGRRLGILLEPISFPAHFLLRFTESDKDWYYIDIFNGGNIIRRGVCPHTNFAFQKELFPVASCAKVVERMANNLELSGRQHPQANGRVTRLRSVLELLKLVSPQDLSALVSLAKFYMLHNMNTKSLEEYLNTHVFDSPAQAQRILHMLRDYAGHHEQNQINILNQVEVAQRTDNLRYAVGMVMLHSTLNYKCVIYDWDPICLATIEWQKEMNVGRLRLRNDQPFYNVLVEDGSYRYVAQENLRPTNEIGNLYMNEDLGRHFSHFFQNHYVPNAEKDREYPQDRKVRHQHYHEMEIDRYYKLLVP